ncbi:MAG: AAA family ATPase [Gammaproteobacteria bacterium]|nr:AAA family ATPase [Gammaproteobacteria bacterium]
MSPSGGDTTAYLRRLGLHADPFRDTADGPVRYSDPSLEELTISVEALLGRAHRPVLVLGEGGLGKSTLLDALGRRNAGGWRMARIEAHPGLDPQALFRAMHAEFGAPDASAEGGLMAAFEQHLVTLERAGQVPVIGVDDAHRLSARSLRTLLAFARRTAPGDGPPLIRLLLLAEPAVENTLSQLEAVAHGAERLHRLALTPFSAEQTASYIEHRLSAAGAGGERPFSAANLAAIQQESGGNPARINAAASGRLAQGAGTTPVSSGTQRRPGRARTLLAALAGALAGALLTAWLAGGPAAEEGPVAAQARPATRLPLPPSPPGAVEDRPGQIGSAGTSEAPVAPSPDSRP